MKIRSFKDDDRGLQDAVNVVLALVMIVIVGAIGIFIADITVTSTALTPSDVAASGTYNFTGAGVTGEYVNITNSTGSTMCYYVNTTGAGKPVGCLVLNVNGDNTPTKLALELQTQLEADGDINSSISVVNTTVSNVIVTWIPAGTVGNSIVTTDTVTNGSWASGTLTGGLDASVVAGMQSNILSAGQTGSSFIVILIIAFIGSIAISYMFGLMGKRQ